MMRRSLRFLSRLMLLWIVLLFACPIQGTKFHPRAPDLRNGSVPQRRSTCETAALDVGESRIIEDACNQNPQNDFDVCYQQIDGYVKQSTDDTCATYYDTYLTCANGHDLNATACSDQQLRYAQCSNYTLQAYAFCGCFYFLPYLLYECANVQLEVRPDTAEFSTALAGAPNAPTSLGGGQGLLSFLPSTSTTPLPSTDTKSSLVPGGLTLTGPLGPINTPPPIPFVTSLAGGSGQITTTSLSTVVVTRTSTITSCAPPVTACPASLPATSTYTETETRTILSCDGGCTGPAPSGAKDICVARRRKRAVVNGVFVN